MLALYSVYKQSPWAIYVSPKLNGEQYNSPRICQWNLILLKQNKKIDLNDYQNSTLFISCIYGIFGMGCILFALCVDECRPLDCLESTAGKTVVENCLWILWCMYIYSYTGKCGVNVWYYKPWSTLFIELSVEYRELYKQQMCIYYRRNIAKCQRNINRCKAIKPGPGRPFGTRKGHINAR